MAGFRSSKMFGSAPDDVIEILATEYVTPNYHQFCTTRQVMLGHMELYKWRDDAVHSYKKKWNT